MKAASPPNLNPVLLIKDTKGKYLVNLKENIYSIGRSARSSIIIQDSQVSRHHATLVKLRDFNNKNCLFNIIDGDLQGNKSNNGLRINGVPCSSHYLQHQDVIAFTSQVKAVYLVVDANLPEAKIWEYFEVNESRKKYSEICDPGDTLITSDNLDRDVKPVSEEALLRLASFPEHLPSPIIELETTGNITYLNPAALMKFSEIQATQLKHPILAGLLDVAVQGKEQLFFREVEMGNAVYEQHVHFLSECGLIRIYLFDVTDRKRIETALRESEERYALAALAANDGLWDLNIKTQEIYFSPRWKTMLGYEESEIENRPEEWFNRLHPEDLERVQTELAVHIEGGTAQFQSEYRMLHKDGQYHWFHSRGIAVKDSEGQVYRMAGSHTDITERKQAEAQLLYNAFHDALTGLSNRALFMDRLGHALKIAQRRSDYVLAVLFLDLDRFKVINDSLGHQAGDQLLIALVSRLQPCVRAGDTVARLGGDEFAILLEDIKTVDAAIEVGDRIRQQFQSPFNLNGQEVFTSVSIGIALSRSDCSSPVELLRDADIAMYHAKTQKSCCVVFDSTMHDRAVTILQLENDLRRAISTSEFKLYYQPIVELTSGEVSGFEALIRWQHPERGWISPGDFIPVAEETGVIISIGYWVLREACRQLHSWHQRFATSPPLTMSVNLSARQFKELDLLEKIQTILLETGIDPSTLKLEITESVIMENAETAISVLTQLKKLGIKIYIDDFGTGYSSLSYLHRFPIDALKIDQSFISRMCVDNESAEIVQTIINLARNLNIGIVAEGVETLEQQERLNTMNHSNGLGQGYYFSRPLDTHVVEDWLRMVNDSSHSEQPLLKSHNSTAPTFLNSVPASRSPCG